MIPGGGDGLYRLEGGWVGGREMRKVSERKEEGREREGKGGGGTNGGRGGR